MASSHKAAVLTYFESIDEIRALDNFRENNPLSQRTYECLVGYYKLREKVYCCVEKANGQLCKHEHGKGWVAKKTDGTITIMGNDCANDKFGADSKIFLDINHAENALRRQTRLAKILAHLEHREERENTLKTLRQSLDSLRTRVGALFEDIGPKTTKRLLDMARARNADVLVLGVKYRIYVEDGHTKKERSTVHHRLGTLKGLDALSKDMCTPIYVTIANVLEAFEAAANLGERPNKGVINALAGRLDQYDQIVRQVDALLKQEAQFNDNPMWLLCFLADDRTERSHCARRAMHQAGIAGGRDQAKSWLADQEARLAMQLGVDKIEIL